MNNIPTPETDAVIAELLEATEKLTRLWDRFTSGDVTYENAYYTFYKSEVKTWEAAKAAIAKTKKNQSNTVCADFARKL